MLILPGLWKLLAAVPLPLGYLLGVARAREARWVVDDGPWCSAGGGY